MKEVLVDLDVVTMAKWDKGAKPDIARAFLARIVEGGAVMVTPVLLLKRLLSWGHFPLVSEMLAFYFDYSEQLLSDKQIKKRFEELGIDDDAVLELLESKGVKREDAFLALVASVFKLSLVTFNKHHLQSKRAVINEVFKKFGLVQIGVLSPESELREEGSDTGEGYQASASISAASSLCLASFHSAVKSPLMSSANAIGSSSAGIFVLPKTFSIKAFLSFIQLICKNAFINLSITKQQGKKGCIGNQ